MGDDALDSMLYAINCETGEKFLIGKGIAEIPKIAPGGNTFKEPIIFEEPVESFECTVQIKTITKKRFIKLLMAKGFQRNYAIKMHEIYKNIYGSRSRLGLELFVETWNTEPEFKVIIGRKEVYSNGKTNNM